MVSSYPFFVMVGVGIFVLLAVLVVSLVIGGIRRRAGRQLSEEFEEAAGMRNRWIRTPERRTA